MKARSLVSFILSSILVILLLSTAAQATEYKEVKAEEILKQIEDGEEVNLTDCRIVGELNVSKIKLETVSNPHFYKLLKSGYTKEYLIFSKLEENISVVESNITIKNSIFENYLDFSNIQFNNSANFSLTKFNDSADFKGANFKDSTNFSFANFSNSTDFRYTNFNRSADFDGVNFNGYAYFTDANFNNYAEFYDANFNGSTDFTGTKFYDSTGFTYTKFSNHTEIEAKEILEQIENCEDINLVNCIIVGELNLSDAKLKTVPNTLTGYRTYGEKEFETEFDTFFISIETL